MVALWTVPKQLNGKTVALCLVFLSQNLGYVRDFGEAAPMWAVEFPDLGLHGRVSAYVDLGKEECLRLCGLALVVNVIHQLSPGYVAESASAYVGLQGLPMWSPTTHTLLSFGQRCMCYSSSPLWDRFGSGKCLWLFMRLCAEHGHTL